MATRADFTPEEWQTLATAPFTTSLAITAASPSGVVGVLKEAFAVSQSLLEADRTAETIPLLRDMIADVKAKAVKPAPPSAKTPAEVKQFSLEKAREVSSLLERKAPADAAAIRGWLLGVAYKVAEASKEGGFLGIGGVRVSPEEKTALDELSTALGVAPAQQAD